MSNSLKYIFILLLAIQSSCSNTEQSNGSVSKAENSNSAQTELAEDIYCSDSACFGVYSGKEFVNGDDIAHQLSNKISAAVGQKLKALYKQELYSQVDFSQISMITEGMGSGSVVYSLRIPFLRVENKCDAYTSFDHVGGWNHSPALESRKTQLQSALLKGDSLFISSLKTTPEGLQEYWIQWRNKSVQFDCLAQQP